MSKSLKMVVPFFVELRAALNQITIGYGEFKDALVTAYLRRTLGLRGGHILVFGPTGTAKTVTTKGMAQILSATGVNYARVSGNPDTMPSDFLMRRVTEYGEDGRPKFVWELQDVEKLRADSRMVLPAILQFDELDKITGRSQHGLLEVMEEQQVSVPKLGPTALDFTLVGTANTRRFDPTAQPISRAVQDRFGSVVMLGYQGFEEDLEMLDQQVFEFGSWLGFLDSTSLPSLRALRAEVRECGLPVGVLSDMRRKLVTVVKLTQQRVSGFTDFTPFIKVVAGPRAILDLTLESMVSALLVSNGERCELTARHPLSVGRRVLRGRVEVTPEAEMDGMTVDVLITKILAEVFGENAQQEDGSENPQPPRQK